ncbi:MAG: DUF29 domain-containing protein [Limnothrix sp. CACIAM 69d]|nr:MAG: DUF29 domain-containing protein [Limnothrix sp. CACIAM 69d]
MNQSTTDAIAPITYDSDYYGWVQQQAELLRSGRFDQLDLENLLEEVESLGRSEKRALVSQLERLYLHLLKWRFQPSKRSNSWVFSIRSARREIQRLLTENPSLKSWLPSAIAQAYLPAREQAFVETKLPLKTFPIEPPFSWELAITLPIEYADQDVDSGEELS